MRNWSGWTHSRFDLHYNYKRAKDRAQRAGKVIATILAERNKLNDFTSSYGCDRRIVSQLQTLIFPSAQFMHRMYDIIERINQEHSTDVSQCEHCGQPSIGGEMTEAYRSEDDSIMVCSTCQGNNFMWSDAQDCYIHTENAVRYYANQRRWDNGSPDYVMRSWGNRNASPMGFYWNFEQESFISNDISLEGDDGDTEDGLADYHNTTRRFQTYQMNPNTIYRNMPPLGLEVEVYAEERYDAVTHMRNISGVVGKLILERDGSLSSEHGFEIVTDPMGCDEWKQFGPHLCKELRNAGCVAYNHPDTDNNYGIHINVHREHLSPLQEARLFMFFTAVENLPFVRAIAQRNGVYAPRLDMGGLSKQRQRMSEAGGLQYVNRYSNIRKMKLCGVGKYTPLNLKTNIAEFRLFQSTLHTPSFMKNIEFVWALIEWVRDSTGSHWQHEKFVQWFGTRGAARRDYPHLYDYLTRPSYRIRHYGGVIHNTWAKYLPLPNPVKGMQHIPLQPANDNLVMAA